MDYRRPSEKDKNIPEEIYFISLVFQKYIFMYIIHQLHLIFASWFVVVFIKKALTFFPWRNISGVKYVKFNFEKFEPLTSLHTYSNTLLKSLQFLNTIVARLSDVMDKLNIPPRISLGRTFDTLLSFALPDLKLISSGKKRFN